MKKPVNKNLYKLRNGIIVQACTRKKPYGVGSVQLVHIPDELKGKHPLIDKVEGSFICLLIGGYPRIDPSKFSGGSYGNTFDVVEKVKVLSSKEI